jgi:hypothetical protein
MDRQRAASLQVVMVSLPEFARYPVVSDPTNTDLAVAIARMEGKIDASILAGSVQILEINRRLKEGDDSRIVMQTQLTSLQNWKSWMTGLTVGLGSIATLTAVYAALRVSGIIH